MLSGEPVVSVELAACESYSLVMRLNLNDVASCGSHKLHHLK